MQSNMLSPAMTMHTLFEGALQATMHETQRSADELRHALSTRECFVCDVLQHQLAHALALQLAQIEPTLRAVYRFEPDLAFGEDTLAQSGPSEESAIYLLAWTGQKSEALARELTALKNEFMEVRRTWRCPQALDWCLDLNIILIDDDDVAEREGYAALLHSLWVQPTCLWRRAAPLPDL